MRLPAARPLAARALCCGGSTAVGRQPAVRQMRSSAVRGCALHRAWQVGAYKLYRPVSGLLGRAAAQSTAGRRVRDALLRDAFRADAPPTHRDALRRCPGCRYGDIDFSFETFLELSGLPPDRVAIEWDWIPCGPLLSGGIRFDPKDSERNPWWQAFFVYNSAQPIRQVLLDGAPLQLSK